VTTSRMIGRKTTPVAPGNVKASRPVRVGKGVCQSGTTLGNDTTEIDYNDHSRSLTGVETFLITHALDHGITDGSGCNYY